MKTTPRPTTTDADLASLAEIVADTEVVERAVTAAQVAQMRVLARAGQLAEKQAHHSDARTRAHDMALRSISAELGGVMRISDRTVQRRIDEARTIVELYPRALDAWQSGRITRAHVLVIVDVSGAVPAGRRDEFEAEAIARCERDTPNRVRPGLEILAQHLHPRTLGERHADAAAFRGIRLIPGSDGMSDLVATLPTVIAAGIHDRLTQQARAVIDARTGRADAATPLDLDLPDDARASDHRGIDAVRADVFADLLLAGSPALGAIDGDGPGPLGTIRARVQVVLPATALTGLDDTSADLVGCSAIDARTARDLAGGSSTWERLFTDPVSRAVTAVDTYRVPLAMRRLLQARDQHCRFPGCRLPAVRCEIDHTLDHALGGPTHRRNLAHLCQRHHSMKQFTPWRVRQYADGILEWTSPTGRVYREDLPRPSVVFIPAAHPEVADPPPDVPDLAFDPPGVEPPPF